MSETARYQYDLLGLGTDYWDIHIYMFPIVSSRVCFSARPLSITGTVCCGSGWFSLLPLVSFSRLASSFSTGPQEWTRQLCSSGEYNQLSHYDSCDQVYVDKAGCTRMLVRFDVTCKLNDLLTVFAP